MKSARNSIALFSLLFYNMAEGSNLENPYGTNTLNLIVSDIIITHNKKTLSICERSMDI